MTSNKILPVALVAALLGGTVGAFVMRPAKSVDTAQTTPVAKNELASNLTPANKLGEAKADNDLLENELADETKDMSADEKAAFRDGFVEGVRAARETEVAGTRTVTRAAAPAASRVVYRNATRTRTVTRRAPQRVYYDYGERRGRSFWDKHRDKLTVAMGTGAGAAIGAAVGGKKGALIGGLAGAGGSALYTYKLRKRTPRY